MVMVDMDCHGGRSMVTVGGGRSGGEMAGQVVVEDQHGRVIDRGIDQNHWWYCIRKSGFEIALAM
jgi:hypothetical protein